MLFNSKLVVKFYVESFNCIEQNTITQTIYQTMTFNIEIPTDIQVKLQGDNFYCEGPFGSLSIPRKKLDPKACILFRLTKSHIQFHWVNKKQVFSANTIEETQNVQHFKDTPLMRSYKGTIKAIFKQSFQGLLQGYLVQIQLIGVGFRVEQSSHEVPLDFKLGFSHPVFYKLPADIRAIISKPTELALYGVDLNRLTQVAAQIKQLRPPERYKGKGIRLSSDILYLKEMKKA